MTSVEVRRVSGFQTIGRDGSPSRPECFRRDASCARSLVNPRGPTRGPSPDGQAKPSIVFTERSKRVVTPSGREGVECGGRERRGVWAEREKMRRQVVVRREQSRVAHEVLGGLQAGGRAAGVRLAHAARIVDADEDHAVVVRTARVSRREGWSRAINTSAMATSRPAARSALRCQPNREPTSKYTHSVSAASAAPMSASQPAGSTGSKTMSRQEIMRRGV